MSLQQTLYKHACKTLAAALLFLMVGNLITSSSGAQNSYQNLILSSDYNRHYLSPYLIHYTQNDEIKTAKDILTKKSLQRKTLPNSSSIISLNISKNTTWLSFDVINRSQQNEWLINFGDQYNGRFGLFNDVTAYSFDYETSRLKKYSLHDTTNFRVSLPVNQKSKIILKLDKAVGTPITTPLYLINSDHNNQPSPSYLFLISTMLLIGMAFFFIAVAIVKFNYNYLFFSAYYIAFAVAAFIQNNLISFHSGVVGGELQAYLFFITALISLITANFFWHPHNKKVWNTPTFFIPALLGATSLIASRFVEDSSNLFNFFLLFGPTILILLVIPLSFIIQNQSKSESATPFMLGWFILLFGMCISILTLSGFLQPVATSINAYWIALIPQAIFFIITARMDAGENSEHITISKTLEINETESISKLRESKENTEQARLLKVIDQERRVLTELRKSEARQTDAMRKAKELADEANKGKSAFLAVVSHEIRTPMTGIMGMVRMLLNSNLTKEQNEYAQTIQDSSDAMLALLNDILDFEKIEQGKMTFENISFDLRRLIQGVSTLMQGHATQKNIDLNVKIGDTLPDFVMGDPTRLRQVLLNLTGNAIKFTETGGATITAELMKTNNADNSSEIYFSVTDNGIGISEQAKQDLFIPFSQADKSISRKFGGTGLGLAISQGLISSMGSEINISSVENEGSTFFFTLNMKHGNKDVSTPPSKTQYKTETIESKNILLVDDNPINQKVVQGLLSELPYKIHSEISAEGGLEKLKTESFDIVLMDIELPGMNGDEATKIIRQSTINRVKKTPVIALTGNTQDGQIQHYYQCGINSLVAKPIDPTALISTIEDAANGIFGNDKKSQKPQQQQQQAQKTQQDNVLTQNLPTQNIDLEIDDTPPAKSIAKPKTSPIGTQPENTINIQKTKVKSSQPASPQEPAITAPPLAPAPTPAQQQKQTPETATVEPITINKKTDNNVLDSDVLDGLKKHLPIAGVQEMTSEALDKTTEIIQELNSAAASNNTDAIKAKCHDLKGMAGNFGLIELSNIAKDIESKVKTQPPLVIASLINALPDAKKRAEKALLEWSSDNQ